MQEIILLSIGAAAILLLCSKKKKVVKMADITTSVPNSAGTNRGLKNNNVGNIRTSADKFKGEIQPSSDKAFKQFKTREYGIRAIFVILDTYSKKYNLNTIEGIISRYAPKKDGNNTDVYIEHVETWTGIPRTKTITSDNDKMKLVKAIIRQETSYIATDSELKNAYNLI